MSKVLLGGQEVVFNHNGEHLTGVIRFIGGFTPDTGSELKITFGDRCLADRTESELVSPPYVWRKD